VEEFPGKIQEEGTLSNGMLSVEGLLLGGLKVEGVRRLIDG